MPRAKIANNNGASAWTGCNGRRWCLMRPFFRQGLSSIATHHHDLRSGYGSNFRTCKQCRTGNHVMEIAWAFVSIAPSGPSSHDQCGRTHAEKKRPRHRSKTTKVMLRKAAVPAETLHRDEGCDYSNQKFAHIQPLDRLTSSTDSLLIGGVPPCPKWLKIESRPRRSPLAKTTA
jgi:hypothetical protein